MTIAPVFPAGIDSFYDAATLILHRDDGSPSIDAPVGTPNLPETRAELDERFGNIIQQIEIRVGWTGDSNVASHETRIAALEAIGPGGSGMSPTLLSAQSFLGAVIDHTPVAISVPEQTVLGRITGGNVTALSVSQIKTLLAYTSADIDMSAFTATINAKAAKSANLSDLASRDTAVTNLLGTPVDITALPAGWHQAASDTLVAVQDGMPVAISGAQLFAGGITQVPSIVSSSLPTAGGSFSLSDTGPGILLSIIDASGDAQPHLVVGTFLGQAFIGLGGGTVFPDANLTWAGTNTIKISNALTIAGLTGAVATGARWVGAVASGVPTTAPAGGFLVGDFAYVKTGGWAFCTSAGTPGTWSTTVGSVSPTFTNSFLVTDGTNADGAAGGSSTTFSAGVGWSLIGVFNNAADTLPSAGAQQIGGGPSLGMGPGGSSPFDILFTRINSTNFSVTGAPTFLNTINVGNTANAVNITIGNTATGTKIGTSTGALMGFWNATPVAQISGSTDVLAGLVTIGLRAASSNPPLNLGTGTLSCGAMNVNGTITLVDTSSVVQIDTGVTNGLQIGTSAFAKLAFYGNTPIVKQAATVDLGTVLNNLGLRSAGTTYPITTSGTVIFSGTVTLPASLSLTTPVIGVATGTSLAVTGALTSSGTAGIGYATGAGGTVTQATSRTTGVTLNKLCGTITLFSTTLAADTDVTFTLTNSTIAAGDLISFNIIGGAAVKGGYSVNAICAAGSAAITVRNHTPTITATEAPQIAFWVHKGVTS